MRVKAHAVGTGFDLPADPAPGHLPVTLKCKGTRRPSPAVFALTFRKLTKTQKFFPNTAEYNEVHEAAEAVMDRFGYYLQKLPQRHERHADQVHRDQEDAALAIVAQECRRHGRCELCVDVIATLAGVGRTTAA